MNGISLLSSNFIEVSKNEVFNNGDLASSDDEGAGILLFDSSNNRITKNEVSDSFDDGIALFGASTDNLISHNEVEDNGGSGLFLDFDSVDNLITFNEFKNNVDIAIDDLSGSNTYWKNKIK